MYLLSLSVPPLFISAELLHLFIAPPLLSLLLFSKLSLPALLLWDYKHKPSLMNLSFLYINLSAESNFRPWFTLAYAGPFTTRWRCKIQCIWSKAAMLNALSPAGAADRGCAEKRRPDSGPAGDRCAEWEVAAQPSHLIHPYRFSARSPTEKTLHHITREYLYWLNELRLSLSPVWRILNMLGNLPVDWS